MNPKFISKCLRFTTHINRQGMIRLMKSRTLAVAVAISLLFLVPAVAARPASAAVASGLYGAYWKNSFFGTPTGVTWPGCAIPPSSPAGVSSGVPPTATEIDPTINFGSTTGFLWDESSPAGAVPSSSSPPGSPGGFEVGSYGEALSSWGTAFTNTGAGNQFVNTDFSVEWTGYIYLAAGTTYTFGLDSDDGSWLYINTTPGSSTISAADLTIDDGGVHAPGTVGSSPLTVTTSGNYPIEVDFYETCDSQSGIDLLWSTSPTGGLVIVPTDVLTPAQIGSNGPTTVPSVPQFTLAAPLVAAASLLALVLLRKRTFGRIGTTT